MLGVIQNTVKYDGVLIGTVKYFLGALYDIDASVLVRLHYAESSGPIFKCDTV